MYRKKVLPISKDFGHTWGVVNYVNQLPHFHDGCLISKMFYKIFSLPDKIVVLARNSPNNIPILQKKNALWTIKNMQDENFLQK